jgi:hypothetical protein
MDEAPGDYTVIRGLGTDGSVFFCRWWTRERVAEYENGDPADCEPFWVDVDDLDTSHDPIRWQPVKD